MAGFTSNLHASQIDPGQLCVWPFVLNVLGITHIALLEWMSESEYEGQKLAVAQQSSMIFFWQVLAPAVVRLRWPGGHMHHHPTLLVVFGGGTCIIIRRCSLFGRGVASSSPVARCLLFGGGGAQEVGLTGPGAAHSLMGEGAPHSPRHREYTGTLALLLFLCR